MISLVPFFPRQDARLGGAGSDGSGTGQAAPWLRPLGAPGRVDDGPAILPSYILEMIIIHDQLGIPFLRTCD